MSYSSISQNTLLNRIREIFPNQSEPNTVLQAMNSFRDSQDMLDPVIYECRPYDRGTKEHTSPHLMVFIQDNQTMVRKRARFGHDGSRWDEVNLGRPPSLSDHIIDPDKDRGYDPAYDMGDNWDNEREWL